MPKAGKPKPARRSARQRKRETAPAVTMRSFLRPVAKGERNSGAGSSAVERPAPVHDDTSSPDSDAIESIHSSEATQPPSPMQAEPVAKQQLTSRSGLTVISDVVNFVIAPSPARAATLCSKCGALAVPSRATSEEPGVAPGESGNESASATGIEPSATEPSMSDLKKYSFRSRLSRRKMLAERAKSCAQPDPEPARPPIKVKIILPKKATEVVDLVSSPKRCLYRSTDEETSTKRRRTRSADDPIVISSGDTVQAPAKTCSADIGEARKKMHSFFKTTQKAVALKKSEAGNRKTCPVAVHPWMSPWATVHVNAPRLSMEFNPTYVRPHLNSETLPQWPHLEKLYCGHAEMGNNAEPVIHTIDHTEAGRVSTWAELYKDCESIDRVNASAVATLVDWLRVWYKGGSSGQASYTTDISSCNTDTDTDMQRIDTERIAILSGPSGCGKSTVIKIAARHLGLSILEINQSVCRRGQKIKDVVGEALKSHRVTSNVQNSTFGKQGPRAVTDGSDADGRSPRTLILFEEVDELHDDERGFWATLRELVSADNCKRPVVCTVNKFSVAMKSVFGIPPLPGEDGETSLLLSNDVAEECINPLPFQHIQLEMRSPRQVCEVLRTVSSRENLKYDKVSLTNLSLTARRGDVRHAVNTLQFWSNPSAVSSLPADNFNIHSACELVCSSPSNDESYSELSRSSSATGDTLGLQLLSNERIDCNQKFSVLQSVYRAASHKAFAGTKFEETFEAAAISNMADALDSFCVADQLLGVAQSGDVDMDFASMDDLQAEADGFLGPDGAAEVSSSLNAYALSSFANSVGDLDGPTVAKVAVKDFAATDAPWYPHLGDTASLSRRTTVTESVPALRTMMITAKRVRQRNATGDANDVPVAGSRRRQTRSQRKADHVLSFNLGEEATSQLERNCLKFEVS